MDCNCNYILFAKLTNGEVANCQGLRTLFAVFKVKLQIRGNQAFSTLEELLLIFFRHTFCTAEIWVPLIVALIAAPMEAIHAIDHFFFNGRP